MLSGIIGRKLGMTQVFLDDGAMEAVTAIEAGPCFVSQIKTQSRDGYDAVQLGFDEVRRLNSPEKGHLKGVGRQLKHLREFGAEDLAFPRLNALSYWLYLASGLLLFRPWSVALG